MPSAVWTYFIPLYVLGAIVLLFGIFVVLARLRGGRYIRPIVGLLAKVPFMRRLMRKASQAALERQNPELASAIRKLERTGGVERDPRRAQAALSRLSASERAAYLEAAGEQGAMPTPQNRQQRRQMEKMRKSPAPRRKA